MPLARLVARMLLGAAGTQIGLRLAPPTRRPVGPFEVSAHLDLDRAGGSRLDIPPLGSAYVHSHAGPLRLTALASAVDPSRAEGLLQLSGADAEVGTRRDATIADAKGELRTLATATAVRAVAAAAAGGAGLAAVGLRRPRDIVATAAVSVAGLLAAGAAAAATVHPDAWRDPELDGLLTRAPLLLGDLRTAPQRMGRYRDQLADLVRTGTAVYERVAVLPGPPPPDAIRLLHISDIHLSPLAFPLAQAMVEQYRVDAVVDTGDLVDWGTPAESAFAGQIGGLGVPYVYVKGNHDSTGIAAAVAQQPNATVLTADGGPVEIAGLTFAGMADPRFTPDKTTGDDRAHHRVAEAATEFAAKLRADGRPIDVALVHSPAAARALAGRAPLVLAGDIHRRVVQRHGDTVVLVQGSTGGAGLRGVQQDPATPCTLSVLYLDRATRRLWGADDVTLGGLGSTELSVVRRTAQQLVATT